MVPDIQAFAGLDKRQLPLLLDGLNAQREGKRVLQLVKSWWTSGPNWHRAGPNAEGLRYSGVCRLGLESSLIRPINRPLQLVPLQPRPRGPRQQEIGRKSQPALPPGGFEAHEDFMT